MMANHPNATAAGLSTLAATGLVWLLNHYASTHLTTYDAGLIAGGAATFVLWIGRRGLLGAFSDVLHGFGGQPKPPPPPPTPPPPVQ
jgi:hypothetical protein